MKALPNFSETIWNEYKYGKDKGDETNYNDMQALPESATVQINNLVRFYYADKEDVFDAG